MAYSLISSASATQTTSGINTTGANLIVLYRSGENGDSVSDNQSNTWTALTQFGVSGDAYGQFYYCYNPVTSASHTFSTSLSYGSIFAMAFSGSKVSPLDSENGAINGTGGSTSANYGNIVPSEDNELIVLGLATGASSSSYSVTGASFTIATSNPAVTGVNYGGSVAYQIQTTNTTVNPTYNWTGGVKLAISYAVFKAGSAAPSANSSFLMFM